MIVMKKAILMAAIFLFPRLLVAQGLDVDSLVGETWYGLYMNGEKAGYAFNSLEKDEEDRIILVEDARFQINMVGVKQDMHISSRRTYLPDGGLFAIESTVVDPSGLTEFLARVEGEELLLISKVAGNVTETRLPKPKESLEDAVKHARWVLGTPQIGDTLNFTVFEPMYQQEITGISHIIGIEMRMLEGVNTKVYQIKTALDLMGIDSVAYVAENGTTLEDEVAGIITMRIEPEEIAKDVQYSNDVIVSNAAVIEEPIENPRERDALRLVLRGPLTQEHLFNDERQFIEEAGDHFNFVARRIVLDGFEPARLPIEDEELQRWMKATVFVQSDDPRLIEKAREIVGEETDTLEISNKLCAWVNANMRSTFSARLTNALEVLESLEGDCTEHSILFIGLARAAGLPAREVAGLVYVDGQIPGFYFHQWAKVWIGKWIDVDPTFNQPLADVTHIKLAEGDLLRQAKLIPIIGKLKIEVLPGESPAPTPVPETTEPEPEPQANTDT
jgi:hypothetical protein